MGASVVAHGDAVPVFEPSEHVLDFGVADTASCNSNTESCGFDKDSHRATSDFWDAASARPL